MTTTATTTAAVSNQSLAELDPEIAAVLDQELGRQRGTLEMIASENFAPRDARPPAGAAAPAAPRVRTGSRLVVTAGRSNVPAGSLTFSSARP